MASARRMMTIQSHVDPRQQVHLSGFQSLGCACFEISHHAVRNPSAYEFSLTLPFAVACHLLCTEEFDNELRISMSRTRCRYFYSPKMYLGREMLLIARLRMILHFGDFELFFEGEDLSARRLTEASNLSNNDEVFCFDFNQP